MDKAREWADQIASSAPIAVQAMKQVTSGIEGLAPRRAYEIMRQGSFSFYEKMLTSDDVKEGVSAFVEKRDASFKNK
jgi:crotonobetainyl-CoA hydratase